LSSFDEKLRGFTHIYCSSAIQLLSKGIVDFQTFCFTYVENKILKNKTVINYIIYKTTMFTTQQMDLLGD